LSGKVAVIKVGGATETEIEEKKFRVDDAVAAVKAALEEGIVAGAGKTLVNLSIFLAEKYGVKDYSTAKLLAEHGAITKDPGVDILIRALNQPMITLMNNAGLNPSAYVVSITGPTSKKDKANLGVDVNTAEIVNLLNKGIVDPTRVVKEAVQNAVSIAGTAMTMGALVVEVPEKTPAASMPDMGGMGMGM
jgi:chaperonin GroEL